MRNRWISWYHGVCDAFEHPGFASVMDLDPRAYMAGFKLVRKLTGHYDGRRR